MLNAQSFISSILSAYSENKDFNLLSLSFSYLKTRAKHSIVIISVFAFDKY